MWGGWHRRVATTIVAGLVFTMVPSPAAAEEPSATVLRTLDDASRRWDAARQARDSGRTADDVVRRAEERIVPAIEARRGAEERVEAATSWLTRAEQWLVDAERAVVTFRRHRDRARAELDTAIAILETRVVRAYKTGTMAAETAWAIAAAREASTPGELATSLKHLEFALDAGVNHVDDATAALAKADADLEAARTLLSLAIRDLGRARDELAAAEAALSEAHDEVDRVEAVADGRRRAADGAEARLLTSLEHALAAEEAAARRLQAMAELDPAPSLLAAVVASGYDDPEAVEVPLEERREWLVARRAALERSRSLPTEARRTVEGWVCPVEDARFVNDWGFPRSHDRRHRGTDLIAPHGTPVRAPAEGTVAALDHVDRFDGRQDLGGITVTVERGRERWYHAHLDAIHPDLEVGGPVEAGQVVGWVGRTGNARGTTPHLHFGWYVDDVAINPYASLVLACRIDSVAVEDRAEPGAVTSLASPRWAR
jgi:peptidoglycan LD-endopeptidase LytH